MPRKSVCEKEKSLMLICDTDNIANMFMAAQRDSIHIGPGPSTWQKEHHHADLVLSMSLLVGDAILCNVALLHLG